MKATVMFSRDELKWHLCELHLSGSFIKGAWAIKNSLTKKGESVFTHVLEVEIQSFETKGGNKFSWSCKDLPDTPTIEECIEKNKADLNLYLSKI